MHSTKNFLQSANEENSSTSSLSIFVEDVDSTRDTYKPDGDVCEMCEKEVEDAIKVENDEIEKARRRDEKMLRKNRKKKVVYVEQDRQTIMEETNKLNVGKFYTREASFEAIKQILEEVEARKHEFCKLLDEHDAVIEHLKRIEKENSLCKLTSQQSPIMI